ncbi:MAG: SWIM zinc finger family protein [Lentisphaeria bacterium]
MSHDYEEYFHQDARDDRFLRAARSALNNYSISQRQDSVGSKALFDLQGGSQDYVVEIDPSWQESPQCSCPDASKGAMVQNRGYCKHIIAVLLKDEHFRYQLLETFL